MNGYVEAGYAVAGVTLSSYGVWILLRSRSIAHAVRPRRDGEAATERPRQWP